MQPLHALHQPDAPGPAPGTETGCTVLLGSHAPILEGAQMSWVIVPFMQMEAPFDELKELTANITEWWSEHGKNRERVGELIMRMGMRAFLEGVGLPPVPQSVSPPGQPLLLLASG